MFLCFNSSGTFTLFLVKLFTTLIPTSNPSLGCLQCVASSPLGYGIEQDVEKLSLPWRHLLIVNPFVLFTNSLQYRCNSPVFIMLTVEGTGEAIHDYYTVSRYNYYSEKCENTVNIGK